MKSQTNTLLKFLNNTGVMPLFGIALLLAVLWYIKSDYSGMPLGVQCFIVKKFLCSSLCHITLSDIQNIEENMTELQNASFQIGENVIKKYKFIQWCINFSFVASA